MATLFGAVAWKKSRLSLAAIMALRSYAKELAAERVICSFLHTYSLQLLFARFQVFWCDSPGALNCARSIVLIIYAVCILYCSCVLRNRASVSAKKCC